MAHIDARKTTTERILYYTKVYKIGEVHDGAAIKTGWNRSKKEVLLLPQLRHLLLERS